MSWIKFDAATPDKPEVWQIASVLGIDPDAVVGKLLRVWIWFDSHTENGNAPSVTKALLDRLVGVTGFCDAMQSAGWLQDDGRTVSLPNFDAHNGETAKKRALTARRVAKHKEKGNAKGNATSVTESVKTALPREELDKEQKQDQKPYAESADNTSAVGTRAGLLSARLRREAGMIHANPSDQHLLAAIAAGCTDDEIVAVAKRYPSKPVSYIATAAIGKRNDAARLAAGENHAGAIAGGQRESHADRVARANGVAPIAEATAGVGGFPVGRTIDGECEPGAA